MLYQRCIKCSRVTIIRGSQQTPFVPPDFIEVMISLGYPVTYCGMTECNHCKNTIPEPTDFCAADYAGL